MNVIEILIKIHHAYGVTINTRFRIKGNMYLCIFLNSDVSKDISNMFEHWNVQSERPVKSTEV